MNINTFIGIDEISTKRDNPDVIQPKADLGFEGPLGYAISVSRGLPTDGTPSRTVETDLASLGRHITSTADLLGSANGEQLKKLATGVTLSRSDVEDSQYSRSSLTNAIKKLGVLRVNYPLESEGIHQAISAVVTDPAALRDSIQEQVRKLEDIIVDLGVIREGEVGRKEEKLSKQILNALPKGELVSPKVRAGAEKVAGYLLEKLGDFSEALYDYGMLTYDALRAVAYSEGFGSPVDSSAGNDALQHYKSIQDRRLREALGKALSKPNPEITERDEDWFNGKDRRKKAENKKDTKVYERKAKVETKKDNNDSFLLGIDMDTSTWCYEDYIPEVLKAKSAMEEAHGAIVKSDSDLRDNLLGSLSRADESLNLVAQVYSNSSADKKGEVGDFVGYLAGILGHIDKGKEHLLSDIKNFYESNGADATMDFVDEFDTALRFGANPRQAFIHASTYANLGKVAGQDGRNRFDDALDFARENGLGFDESLEFAADSVAFSKARGTQDSVSLDELVAASERHSVPLNALPSLVRGLRERDSLGDDKHVWAVGYEYIANSGKLDPISRANLADSFVQISKEEGLCIDNAYDFIDGAFIAIADDPKDSDGVMSYSGAHMHFAKAYGSDVAVEYFAPAFLTSRKKFRGAEINLETGPLFAHARSVVDFVLDSEQYKEDFPLLVDKSADAPILGISRNSEQSLAFARGYVDSKRAGYDSERWQNAVVGYVKGGADLSNALKLSGALESYAKAHGGEYVKDRLSSYVQMQRGVAGSLGEAVDNAIERLGSANGGSKELMGNRIAN